MKSPASRFVLSASRPGAGSLRLAAATLALFALVPAGTRSQTPTASPTPARVVAIGDIHGALDEFRTILKHAGLTDEAQRWTGGASTLVQTGDYTDRGAQVRGVLDLLIALERDAAAREPTQHGRAHRRRGPATAGPRRRPGGP